MRLIALIEGCKEAALTVTFVSVGDAEAESFIKENTKAGKYWTKAIFAKDGSVAKLDRPSGVQE